METKKRSNSVVSAMVGETTVKFVVDGFEPLVLDTTKINQVNRDRAVMHGFKQRIQDAAAISRDTETGQPASPAEKYEAMKVLVDHYNSGTPEWNIARAAGSPRETGGMLLEALAQLNPKKTRDELQTFIKGLNKTERDAVSTSKKVAPVIEAIRAKRAKATGIDGDALLDAIL